MSEFSIVKNIVLLASGEGTNFSAIINNGIKVDIVITKNPSKLVHFVELLMIFGNL